MMDKKFYDEQIETYKQSWDAFLEAYKKLLKENNQLRRQLEKMKTIKEIRKDG